MASSTLPNPQMNWDSGNIEENWKKFLQHAKLMFSGPLASKSEEQHVSYFLIWIGEKGRDIYNTWELTDEQRKKLDILYAKFKEYITPRSNKVFSRFKFNQHVQQEGESFDQFVTELKLLVKDCGYTEPEEMVRDRIVFGCQSKDLREKLIEKGSTLTLVSTLEITDAHLLSREQMKSMSETDVHAIKRRIPQRQQKSPQISKSKQPNGASRICQKCGRNHKTTDQCPARGKECYKCKKKNHFSSMCRSKPVHSVEDMENNTYADEGTVCEENTEFFVDMVKRGENSQDTAFIKLKLANKCVNFKLDTGAEVNVMPMKVFKTFQQVELKPTEVRLTSYTGQQLDVAGQAEFECSHKGKQSKLKFVVVKTNAVPLLGFRSCQELNLIKVILAVDTVKPEEEYQDVFKGIGLFPGEYHIKIDETVSPVVNPPRRIPQALHSRVKDELDRMEKLEIVAKVDEPTDWVNSIVIVEKPQTKSLRICIDPKSLNSAIKREHYRTRTIDDLLHKLKGAKIFSKVDARSGYWNVKLSKDSSYLTTFNTPFGRYRFLRLPFGLKSAQDVFQKRIDETFQDIPGIEIVADDILIFSTTTEEHNAILRKLFDRARKYGVKFNMEKSSFRMDEVCFYGHHISRDGLKADPSKIAAITDMKPPESKSELQTLLGMVNFLSRYAPNLADVAAPLRQLVMKNVQFQWNKTYDKVHSEIIQLLCRAPVLTYFDSSKDITIQCDASQNGVGACLMQDEKPIAYASKALTDTQQRWAQIEKELFSVVFGCEKFHEYVYGRNVRIQNDHKPLESIFKKDLCKTPPRLQRMLLKLQKYDITIQFTPGKDVPVADLLSRKNDTKLDSCNQKFPEEVEYHVHAMYSHVPVADMRLQELHTASKADAQYQLLRKTIEEGWPNDRKGCPKGIAEYWCIKEDLHIVDNLIFKGNRLVIPPNMRKYFLEKLHTAHLGIEKTKSRARQVAYWPRIDNDIEVMISHCAICQRHRFSNQKEPLMSHKIPELPWECVGTDLFMWNNEQYLIVVDYYSRFFEFEKLHTLTSQTVINKLKNIFATHGIPQTLISDNGPQFSSELFTNFAKTYAFTHKTSSPHHPKSNGLAEKAVGIAKRLLSKTRESKGDIALSLLEYRNTPICGSASPAQLLMGRSLRSILPVTTKHLAQKAPNNQEIRKKILNNQKNQATFYNRRAKALPPLTTGDHVRVQKEGKWDPAIVTQKHNERSYTVKTNDGEYRRNRLHLNKSFEQPDNEYHSTPVPNQSQETSVTSPSSKVNGQTKTRSGRISKPPDRWSPC